MIVGRREEKEPGGGVAESWTRKTAYEIAC